MKMIGYAKLMFICINSMRIERFALFRCGFVLIGLRLHSLVDLKQIQQPTC
jgi:hypothetical protein